MIADKKAKEARQIADKARNDANEANKKVSELTGLTNTLNATIEKKSQDLESLKKDINAQNKEVNAAKNDYLITKQKLDNTLKNQNELKIELNKIQNEKESFREFNSKQKNKKVPSTKSINEKVPSTKSINEKVSSTRGNNRRNSIKKNKKAPSIKSNNNMRNSQKNNIKAPSTRGNNIMKDKINQIQNSLSQINNDVINTGNLMKNQQKTIDTQTNKAIQLAAKNATVTNDRDILTNQLQTASANLNDSKLQYTVLNNDANIKDDSANIRMSQAIQLTAKLNSAPTTPPSPPTPIYIWKIVINNVNTLNKSKIIYSSLELILNWNNKHIVFTEKIKDKQGKIAESTFSFFIGDINSVDLYILVYPDNTYKISHMYNSNQSPETYSSEIGDPTTLSLKMRVLNGNVNDTPISSSRNIQIKKI
jgi:chromosome segregation ATPase